MGRVRPVRFAQRFPSVCFDNRTMQCLDSQCGLHFFYESLAPDGNRPRPLFLALCPKVGKRFIHPFSMSCLKVRHIRKTAQFAQRLKVDDAASLGRVLNLSITAMFPLGGVTDSAGAHPIEIDVHQATMKMLIGFDGSGVIAIFPEGALTRLAQVVLLRRATRDQLTCFARSHRHRHPWSVGVHGWKSPCN